MREPPLKANMVDSLETYLLSAHNQMVDDYSNSQRKEWTISQSLAINFFALEILTQSPNF